jgi:hypothetical protein
MVNASDRDGGGDSLPITVWVPIALGSIELFRAANTPAAFWIDASVALAIGAVGFAVAQFRGLLPAAVRYAVAAYAGALVGAVLLEDFAEPISWREVLVVAMLSGVVYAGMAALIESGAVRSRAFRRRSGSR